MSRVRPPFIRGVVLVLSLSIAAAAQSREGSDGSRVAERLGARVEQYLSVARRVSARETVTLQPLSADLSPTGALRRLVYDTRVEWEPDDAGVEEPSASVRRVLLSINGRKPRDNQDEGCLAERMPEPLALLLPSQRERYRFEPADPERSKRRWPRLAYIPTSKGTPSLSWRGDCGTFELPGMLRGELTYDPETLAVVTLTHRLTRPQEMNVPREQRRDDWAPSVRIERAELTVTYQPVKFREPEETVMLPVAIEELTVLRTPRVQALRVTQRFSNHTRFVTEARVVPIP